MDFIHEIKKIAKENGGIIDNKSAASVGISRAMLSKLCKKNENCRCSQKIYGGYRVMINAKYDTIVTPLSL